MLWHKAWRESQARFLLSAVAISGLCIGFVVFHQEGAAGISDQPLTYVEYIWGTVYKGFVRELFVVFSLLLGIGGLLRERDRGTVGFTLALPVSRLRLVSIRAAVGLSEIAGLSLLPWLILPSLSSLVGQSYPWSQASQFALLWASAGTFFFVIGFLASTVFYGEFTSLVAAFLGLVLYSVIADLPFLEQYSLDIHDIMSGHGMPYFQLHGALLVGPLPWMVLAVIVLTTLGLVGLACRITEHRDF
jgi:ABC-type transport system involved in multi-copper enzyme maturation permease subunit